MSRRRGAGPLGIALSVLLANLLGGCAEEELPRTQIMVAVDSDLQPSTELDMLRIEVTGPDAKRKSSTASLGAGEPPLPRSLALLHEGGPRGPLLVEVQGRLGDQLVISRRAELSFVAGHTLVLPMHLVRSCLGISCAEDQTCTEQGCSALQIASETLAEWDGDKPSLSDPPADAGLAEDGATGELDAGKEQDAASASDAALERDAGEGEAGVDSGMCSPQPEQCNRLDDDCDGKIDNGYDLLTNANHCGGCNMRCSPRDMCCQGSCLRTCQ